MIFLLVLWAIVASTWLAVVAKRWKRNGIQFSFAISGLAVVISGSVIGYDFFHLPAAIPITVDRLFLALLVAIFCCLLLRKKVVVRRFVAVDYCLFALLLALLCSAFSGEWNYLNNRPVSRFLFFYLLPACLYFLIKNTRISERELKVVAIGFCLFCVYLASTAVAEWRGLYSLVFPTYIRDPGVMEFFGRGRGPFMNPISNGVFLTTGLTIAIVIWWNCSGRMRILMAAIIPLLVIGNVATLTRSVWVAMVVAVGIVAWLITDRRQRAVLIIAGTVGAVLLFGVVGQSMVNFKRDKYVSQNEMSQSAQLRPIFAVVAYEMFKDRPIFGCGFGRYNKYKAEYFKIPDSNLQLSKAKPYLQHNVVLSLLTETGLIGCSILLLLIGRAYYDSTRLFRNVNAPRWARSYALVLIALLTTYLINGMFHDVSIIPMAHALLFFLLAIVTSLHQSHCIERQPNIVPVQSIVEFQTFLKMRLNRAFVFRQD